MGADALHVSRREPRNGASHVFHARFYDTQRDRGRQ
jgi:hypothetical protein